MPALERVLPFAKSLLRQVAGPGDTVIDATAGNGHDTLFLADLVTDQGRVFSFDVQPEALESTRQKLAEAGIRHVRTILAGHQHVLDYVNEPISGALFNLGYLPGSDQSISTFGETTWEAVTKMLGLLKVNGLIVLVVYHGHEAGKVEKDYLEQAFQELDSRSYQILKYQFINRKDAPYIVAIEKLHD